MKLERIVLNYYFYIKVRKFVEWVKIRNILRWNDVEMKDLKKKFEN